MFLFIAVYVLKPGRFAVRVFKTSEEVEVFCKTHKVIDVPQISFKLDICGEE